MIINLPLYDVFTSGQPHTIAVSYQRGLLRVAIDGQMRPETLRITPALAFFTLMLPFKANYVLARYRWILDIYTLLYTSLLFIPVGLMLALGAAPSWTIRRQSIGLLGGISLSIAGYAGLNILGGGVWSSPELMALQTLIALISWAAFQRIISRVAPL
ncbi:MAG: hypothetical protein HGA65_18710 [Oscillochloris sp.]|nr:hypothetical protein [Oscillochloris sp.]